MKLTVFGATGGTGQQVVRQACEAGHAVTAVVRDPARLAYESTQLTVVAADVLDPATIGAAIAGQDVVISALGSRSIREPTTLQTDSTISISTAMREHGARRLIVVSNSGMIVDEHDGPVSRWLTKPIARRVLRHPWADMQRMEEVVRTSELDWTIVRPPQLIDKPRTDTYRIGFNHNVRGGNRASRANVADYILHCCADDETIGAAISIAD